MKEMNDVLYWGNCPKLKYNASKLYLMMGELNLPIGEKVI